MLSLALVAWAVALINLAVGSAVLFAILFGGMFLADWITRGPVDRASRERRRHAKKTARAMRRMTTIRHQTSERMDRAEREGWR
jgi:hypothetical protein